MLASKQRAAILYSLYAVVVLGLYGVGVGIGAPASLAPSAADLPPWYTVDAQGKLGVHLYVFWSTTCPHCKRAMPFLKTLEATYPWLRLQALELTQHRAHVTLYRKMAAALGRDAASVPAFLFCNDMVVGYASEATTGQILRQKLLDCYEHLKAGTVSAVTQAQDSPEPGHIAIPFLGSFDSSAMSLPVVTFVIAGLDAFNPCAFFVLLFLLSLLVHAHNRPRMLLIGGIFVVCSGLMYFVFMAAWLNLFLIIGQLRLITVAAGAIAYSWRSSTRLCIVQARRLPQHSRKGETDAIQMHPRPHPHQQIAIHDGWHRDPRHHGQLIRTPLHSGLAYDLYASPDPAGFATCRILRVSCVV